MRAIWKFPLVVTDEQTVNLPKGAQALAVQVQHGQPCLWALVDPDAPIAAVGIRMHGTGHTIPDDLEGYSYIGTFQMMGGALVFHTFRRDSPL